MAVEAVRRSASLLVQHGCRFRGLVGRNVDEGLDADRCRGGEHRSGAQHVGLEPLLWVRFQHRQVLQGSGMEHDLGPELFKDRSDAGPIAHIGEHQVLVLQERPTGER